ncbi:MAG: hypothetical protein U0Q18_27860 [Bryobacteraceae bacterium]
MEKPGIHVDIPGFGRRHFTVLVSDYTGTQSMGGRVGAGVRKRLRQLARVVDLRILTADTFGTAARELKGITEPYLLRTSRQDVEKRKLVSVLSLRKVVAIGNGNNDRLMLRAVKRGGGLAIAVDNGEGCSVDALLNANIFIHGAENALDLLLETPRIKATLRF